MKSNDALLTKIINTNEKNYHKAAKLISDERIINPDTIKVGANEVAYVHLFHSNVPDFDIEIQTATETLTLNRKNTIDGNSNTILRTVSDMTFNSTKPKDFFIQLLRIQY
ncbi:hypothetical protein [Aquimarina mytili]|uniref:Uncharacterized protein n=1 Tax=Aquimarina mytili TaxID=874423 RepID=A0A937A011_9FLAO|nr:hypothetical protein [Aquimarina mytili]MBL0684316.1 hypothetical protein [Aquimarina mytili]